MNILAFDTATSSCSIALLKDGNLSAEATSLEKGTHSARLLPMIDQLLKRKKLKLAAIDGFAATIGPGSFTGLRIGISTLKGLAAATGAPVVVVSTLEALAHQCTVDIGLICPLLDARKREVYSCIYRRVPDGLEALTGERCAPPDDAVGEIESACAFIGDGAEAYRDVIQAELGRKAVFAPAGEHVIRAATVAALAHRRFEAGDTDDPLVITPRYLRESDAVSASVD